MKFVVGLLHLEQAMRAQVLEEARLFDDMLLLHHLPDSYKNLTEKLRQALIWADHNVLSFDYLVKCDDDSFVQVDHLIAALKQMDCPKNLYWGFFTGNAVPQSSGRWRELNWHLCPQYLPYAVGGGYILSRKLVSLVTRYSNQLVMYSNEDVAMGTWLAPYWISRRHDLRFNTESHSRGCNNHHIITHKEKVSTFISKRQSLLKNGTLCRIEREIRPGYHYNWTAPPELCCQKHRRLVIADG